MSPEPRVVAYPPDAEGAAASATTAKASTGPFRAPRPADAPRHP